MIAVFDDQLYRKDLPPLQQEGELIKLLVHLDIVDIGNIDESQMTITLKCFIHLEW
jgi:hypothetical protein